MIFLRQKTKSHDFNCCFLIIMTDTDRLVLSMNTNDIIIDLYNLKISFDFSNLNINHELLTNKNKKTFGKYKIETSKK